MGLKSVVENILARGLQDVLDPEVRAAYATFKDIEKNGIFLQAEDIVPYAEQLVYRMTQCPECVRAGKCLHCKCPMPDKIIPPDAKCSQGRWGQMKDGPEWEEQKESTGLEFIAIVK